MGDELTVVVVDDDDRCRELYCEWLRDGCTVRTAANGEQALDLIDHAVDLTVLDRDLPEQSGRAVAVELDELGYDVHIVMVGWLAPDFDIVEYPIDSYVEKPLTEGDMSAIVDQYRRQDSYLAALVEYFALSAKLAAIYADNSQTELESNPECDRFKGRVAEQRAQVDDAIGAPSTDWDYAFKSCGRAMEVEGSTSSGSGG